MIELTPKSTDMIARSLAVFERLFELAPYAFVLFEPQGRIVLVNARAEEIFGCSRDELLSCTLDVLLPDLFQIPPRDARKGHGDRVQPDMSAMDPEQELYARRKNGSEIPVKVSLNPVEVDGNILVLALIRDTTDRSRAEEKVLNVSST